MGTLQRLLLGLGVLGWGLGGCTVADRIAAGVAKGVESTAAAAAAKVDFQQILLNASGQGLNPRVVVGVKQESEVYYGIEGAAVQFNASGSGTGSGPFTPEQQQQILDQLSPNEQRQFFELLEKLSRAPAPGVLQDAGGR